MSINDGGYAFPCMGSDRHGLVAAPGMSMRDWFAGQALVGMIADARGLAYSDIPPRAYEAADAMLKEREKQP